MVYFPITYKGHPDSRSTKKISHYTKTQQKLACVKPNLTKGVRHLKISAVTQQGGNAMKIVLDSKITKTQLAELLRSLDEASAIGLKDANGNSLLHYAAAKGDKKSLTRLLKIGVEIDRPNKQGVTPLFMAAKYHHNDILQELLDSGAKANITAEDEVTTAHSFARWYGNRDGLSILNTASPKSRDAENAGIARNPLVPLLMKNDIQGIKARVASGMDINQQCEFRIPLASLYLGVLCNERTTFKTETLLTMFDAGLNPNVEFQSYFGLNMCNIFDEIALNFDSMNVDDLIRVSKALVKSGIKPESTTNSIGKLVQRCADLADFRPLQELIKFRVEHKNPEPDTSQMAEGVETESPKRSNSSSLVM